jgi:UDP-N-acetylmuramoyl-tripeptide--D-alanyl-D-alanine ligase
MRINLNDIFDMPTAVIYEPDKFRSASGVVIDSRQKVKNSIFVAIKGKNFDGHDFVKQAVEKGAVAVVINSRKLSLFDDLDVTIITVKNTVKAYGYLAKVWRRKSGAKVISLTGSNGKTTTKEILASLLGTKYIVVKTERNNNNQIGVPLTILNVTPKTEVLILEHGTNHPGEIAYTAEIAEPDFALITNVGASHLQFFGNIDGVLEEKFSLFKAALENKGKIFVNNDDSLLRKASLKINNKITFGFKGKPDVRGKIVSFDEFGRPEIEIYYKGRVIKVKLPLLGKANAYNFLSAAAVALEMGIGKNNLVKAAASLKSVKGRLNLNELNGFVLVDDTYNSNPVSVAEAVSILKKIKAYSPKVLILGDMLELGEESKLFHSDLAKEITKLKKFEVLTIGKNMKALADTLGSNAKHFASRKNLKKHLSKMELKGKCFLVKGSRGMMMEEFVDLIKTRDGK